jgi:hypothetical protein
MNNLPGVQASLPPTFVTSGQILTPPDMSFGGDSLWGQFLNRHGGIHQDRYDHFLTSLNKAGSWTDLLSAFSLPVVMFKSAYKEFDSQFPLPMP